MAKAKTDSAKRVFFTKDDNALPLPNLIAHQKDSWREFVETGLSEIFSELNPIDDYTGQKLSLRFNDYAFDEPKNSEPRVPGIIQSTTYKFDTAEQIGDVFDLKDTAHIYSRISNPTVAQLEEKINALEVRCGESNPY